MCKIRIYVFAIALLILIPNLAFSQLFSPQIIPCDCKPQSWKKFDSSAPVNSAETWTERRQKYAETAINALQQCLQWNFQIQTPVEKDQPKESKQKAKCEAKVAKKIDVIRKKYGSNIK